MTAWERVSQAEATACMSLSWPGLGEYGKMGDAIRMGPGDALVK
jgi:hypothetical protein